MTVLRILEKKYPKMLEQWDKWNYRVTSPISLDDLATVGIILINKDKTFVACEIPLVGFEVE